MKRALATLGLALGLLLALAGITRADYLVVSRSATAKAAPRGDATVLLHVAVGETFALVAVPGHTNDQVDGYYEVQLPDGGGLGWIHRNFVRRFAGAMPASAGTLPGPAGTGTAGAGKLEVHVIDVGQGDAILIRCPDGNHQMLIDSGDTRYPGSAEHFKSYLSAIQSTNDPIEVVVASHPHTDHIGNMDWVLDTYQVGLYVDNGNTQDTRVYERVEAAYGRRHPQYWDAKDDVPPEIAFCTRPDVHARVLRPQGFGHDKNPNNDSVVIRIDYGARSFLFMGDAEVEEEQELENDPAVRPLLDCDFLKASHHGSDTSSSQDLLNLVTPSVVSVSCGAEGVSTNATYKHPRLSTIEHLLQHAGPRQGPAVSLRAYSKADEQWESVTLNKAVYVTVAQGNLVFECDGAQIRKR